MKLTNDDSLSRKEVEDRFDLLIADVREYAIFVVAPDGTILPSGQAGELALGGPQLSLGYLADEALTAKRFPTLFHPRLGYTRWFLTGHPASRDEAGLFHSPGHIDNQVKVLGHRVEMEEV